MTGSELAAARGHDVAELGYLLGASRKTLVEHAAAVVQHVVHLVHLLLVPLLIGLQGREEVAQGGYGFYAIRVLGGIGDKGGRARAW